MTTIERNLDKTFLATASSLIACSNLLASADKQKALPIRECFFKNACGYPDLIQHKSLAIDY
jgi:hypothetical protein